MRLTKPLLAAALWLLTPSFSHAFSYIDNRGLLPIGEVEAFMANTGVALSGSTGAVYYNPAGLASLTQNHLSVSANSYLKTQSDLNPLQTLDGTDFNFHVDGLQTIPTSFVSTGKVGDAHYAFSILVPHQIKVQDSTAYSTPHYPSLQYSRTNSLQTLMIGPSVASRFQNTYDVGFGCFYTLTTSTLASTLTGNTDGQANALVINSYFDSTVNGLMCNAGVQMRVSEPLRVGFTLRSPMLKLSSSGTATQFVQSPNNGLSATTGPKSVNADVKVPTDLSLGAEYRFAPMFAGYLDVSYQFAQTQNSGDIFADDETNNATPRASLGLSYLSTPSVNLFAGVAYNPSSVQTTASDYSEDFLIGTLGSRWSSGNTNLGVGFMYGHSTGSKPSPIYDYQLNQTGSKTASVETTAYGVLISSGFLF